MSITYNIGYSPRPSKRAPFVTGYVVREDLPHATGWSLVCLIGDRELVLTGLRKRVS